MIQATDLRIGNWVKMISKDKYYFIDRGYNLDNSEDLNPIELTEEILLKCGFSFMSKNKMVLNSLVLFNFTYGIVYRGEFMDTKIKYIHQLQNLYFALKNEELQVNL